VSTPRKVMDNTPGNPTPISPACKIVGRIDLDKEEPMTNSNRKGKRGELEAAKALRTWLGCEARRGQQFAGGTDSPDVLTSIENVHFEVKRCEKLQLYKAVDQAITDADGKVPVVLHRANRHHWVAIVPLCELPRLAEALNSPTEKGA